MVKFKNAISASCMAVVGLNWDLRLNLLSESEIWCKTFESEMMYQER